MKKFNLGDRVKILSVKGITRGHQSRFFVGFTGVVSAVYDPELTPNNYPKCEYRVSIHYADSDRNNNNTVYVVESDIVKVKTVPAFCFHDGEEYHWKSTNKPKRGLVRQPDLDHYVDV